MRVALFAIIGAMFVGCARTPDAIDQLVADLSSTHGMWINGFTLDIHLPATQSTQQVVEQVFKQAIFDTGRAIPAVTGKVTSYKILKIRQVHIFNNSPQPDIWTRVFSLFKLERLSPSYGLVPTDLYTAVLVQTNFGEKIVLLQAGGTWWCRCYDANRVYYAKPSV